MIIELYQKLGWYDEVVKYHDFINSDSGREHFKPMHLKPSLTESFLESIEYQYRIIDVFLHMGYIYEATETCEIILQLLANQLFENVFEIEELQNEGLLRMFIIFYKYQKNYKKAGEFLNKDSKIQI